MRKTFKFITVLVLAIVAFSVLTGCSKGKKYLDAVNSYGFWKNDLSQAVAQADIVKFIDEHMNSALPEGKTEKKVAVIGYDGARADALVNSIQSGVLDNNGNDIYSGYGKDSAFSGVSAVKNMKNGGAYIAYAGGNKGGKNEQHPSTAPGWASLLTGKWGIDNGVTNNNMTLKFNDNTRTFLLNYAEHGVNGVKYDTLFTASWGEHFKMTYKPEIDYVANKKTEGVNISFQHLRVNDDWDLHKVLLASITEGGKEVNIKVSTNDEDYVDQKVMVEEKDVIFGIYEHTDYNGHGTGFGNQNPGYVKGFKDEDAMAYELIETIQNRSTYANEDWLYIITSDHGGINTWHGGQSAEERTIFVVTNKIISENYFSKNYNGFKEKA